MSRFRKWIDVMLNRATEDTRPQIARKALTERQMDVADRLAEMKGVTRDQVLAEAYRRVARLGVESESIRRQH